LVNYNRFAEFVNNLDISDENAIHDFLNLFIGLTGESSSSINAAFADLKIVNKGLAINLAYGSTTRTISMTFGIGSLTKAVTFKIVSEPKKNEEFIYGFGVGPGARAKVKQFTPINYEVFRNQMNKFSNKFYSKADFLSVFNTYLSENLNFLPNDAEFKVVESLDYNSLDESRNYNLVIEMRIAGRTASSFIKIFEVIVQVDDQELINQFGLEFNSIVGTNPSIGQADYQGFRNEYLKLSAGNNAITLYTLLALMKYYGLISVSTMNLKNINVQLLNLPDVTPGLITEKIKLSFRLVQGMASDIFDLNFTVAKTIKEQIADQTISYPIANTSFNAHKIFAAQ
jgi:hypothetical protein